eukprot:Amastigsp_a176078_30.p3 type:complete len:166 gc:universal Amastigsp_a176078_30:970-1467(+)
MKRRQGKGCAEHALNLHPELVPLGEGRLDRCGILVAAEELPTDVDGKLRVEPKLVNEHVDPGPAVEGGEPAERVLCAAAELAVGAVSRRDRKRNHDLVVRPSSAVVVLHEPNDGYASAIRRRYRAPEPPIAMRVEHCIESREAHMATDDRGPCVIRVERHRNYSL